MDALVCAVATDAKGCCCCPTSQDWLKEARQLTLYHCVPTRSARVVWLLEVGCCTEASAHKIEMHQRSAAHLAHAPLHALVYRHYSPPLRS